MEMDTRKFRATFTEGLLATKPNDENIHETYVASKRKEGVAKEELEAEENALSEIERLEKGTTIFHKDSDGFPIVWDYQIKGFLKDAIKNLRRNPKTESSKVKNYKGVVDGSIFIKPRMIRLHIPEGSEIGTCQRPLRAETMQGPRTALAQSEEAPVGTYIEFEVMTIVPNIDKVIDECFEYAKFRFMGAWRNSGKGTAEIVELPR